MERKGVEGGRERVGEIGGSRKSEGFAEGRRGGGEGERGLVEGGREGRVSAE